MNVVDLLFIMQNRPKTSLPTGLNSPETNWAEAKKIAAIALKTLFLISQFRSNPNTFALSFSMGLFAKIIARIDFSLQELEKAIDKDPMSFVKTVLVGYAHIYPNSSRLGPLASGFYTGVKVGTLTLNNEMRFE